MASDAHKELVARAARWLLTTAGMGRVVTEPAPGWCPEHPDAIGWDMRGWSILVECKVSRSDFLADLRKRRRWAEAGYAGMGQERYFMTPPKLLDPADIPDGWGLLEAGRRVRRVVQTPGRVVVENGVEVRRDPDPKILLNDWRVVFGALYTARQVATGVASLGGTGP